MLGRNWVHEVAEIFVSFALNSATNICNIKNFWGLYPEPLPKRRDEGGSRVGIEGKRGVGRYGMG
jgi:hypothetical protein